MVSLVITEANSTSPQAVMKAYTATAMIPGSAAGTTTRKSAPSGPQPSTYAASSSSRGTDAKYPVSIQMENGRENVR